MIFIIGYILQSNLSNTLQGITGEKCLVACHQNIIKGKQPCKNIILNNLL